MPQQLKIAKLLIIGRVLISIHYSLVLSTIILLFDHIISTFRQIMIFCMIMLSIISFPTPKLTNPLTNQPANIENFQVLVQND